MRLTFLVYIVISLLKSVTCEIFFNLPMAGYALSLHFWPFVGLRIICQREFESNCKHWPSGETMIGNKYPSCFC